MKRNYRRTLVGAALGLAMFSWGCQQSTPGTMSTTNASTSDPSQMTRGSHKNTSHDMAMGNKGVETLKSLQGKEFDIAFLSQMITHHQGAVDMAKEALKVSRRPETKAEAQMVIDGQTREIDQMTAWLQDWYDTAPVAEQQAIMREDMKAMMAMQISNDHAFFDMMIPHHEGAIEMSQLASSRASKPELKEMAQKIIHDQQSEIKKYQSLSDKDH